MKPSAVTRARARRTRSGRRRDRTSARCAAAAGGRALLQTVRIPQFNDGIGAVPTSRFRRAVVHAGQDDVFRARQGVGGVDRGDAVAADVGSSAVGGVRNSDRERFPSGAHAIDERSLGVTPIAQRVKELEIRRAAGVITDDVDVSHVGAIRARIIIIRKRERRPSRVVRHRLALPRSILSHATERILLQAPVRRAERDQRVHESRAVVRRFAAIRPRVAQIQPPQPPSRAVSDQAHPLTAIPRRLSRARVDDV